ncbi:LacI family transcriptional regulator [Enterococcus sp. DIV0840]|uniref:LacI family DNA-binding transcriptional regulator n=1 Tax=Enterococcus TaxID=1350 RepID=UPI001A8FF7B5|nr:MULTISPECIES: LacI family DNA-binding transcriptional regulator [Enterococcus]MBO0435963.1 LacI family DNA-binding transcriptional regulator [Enterococcus sp. DIV0849a]MBO0475248.1 LacI family DNA-binding transcriptional regulator [Enterococcus ureasiticus]
MKNYSIKDIAEIAGVSVATVSRVINDNGRFSEETRKKVLKVIEETGYKMNYSAKNLRMNKSFTIGILVPDISNYFFSDVVQQLEEILFAKGYSTIICNTSRSSEKELAYLRILEGKGVDGLIVISGAEAFQFDSSSAEKKIPYICIDREPKKKEDTVFISSNHYQGAFESAEELIREGCQHPVIAMHNQKSTSAKERLKGFKDALKKNSISFNPKQHLLSIDIESEDFEHDLLNFLKKNPETDGIFSINDLIALELMLRLKKNHIAVPQKIKLIGFDDTPSGKYTTPTLSSVKQNTDLIANHAVETLLELINKKGALGRQIVVPVSLVLRESSK